MVRLLGALYKTELPSERLDRQRNRKETSGSRSNWTDVQLKANDENEWFSSKYQSQGKPYRVRARCNKPQQTERTRIRPPPQAAGRIV